MEAQNVFVLIVLIGIGVVALIAVIWGLMMEMGGPPAGPDQVIEYYDDLFDGKINGKEVNMASVALGFLIPLLSSFSVLWALIGILPIFSKNPRSAMVFALGIAFYFTPLAILFFVNKYPAEAW